MSYACDICGKGKQFGKNVPFSQKKTNKVWKPNLQKQYIELDGTRMQIKSCTQCLRTLEKYAKKAADHASRQAGKLAAEAAPKEPAKA